MSAKPTVTNNADGSVTESYKLSEMDVEQLVTLSQGVGRQIDKLRQQRADLKALIDKKLHEQRHASVKAEIARLQAQIDGDAPGAVIEASAAKG